MLMRMTKHNSQIRYTLELFCNKLMATARIDIRQYKHRYCHRKCSSNAGQKLLHVHNKSLTSYPKAALITCMLSQPHMPMQ